MRDLHNKNVIKTPNKAKIVKFDSQIKQIWKRTFENTKFSERKIVINIHNFFSYRSWKSQLWILVAVHAGKLLIPPLK